MFKGAFEARKDMQSPKESAVGDGMKVAYLLNEKEPRDRPLQYTPIPKCMVRSQDT